MCVVAPVAPVRGVRVLDIGSGPVLVCSSGVASTAWDWWPVVRLLRDRFRVVVVDRPGYAPGDVVPEEFPTLREEAERILDVLDALGIAEPVTGVGHSFGAAVVEAAARLHPERMCGLVLLDGSVPEVEGIDSERESARAAERFRRIILPVVLSRPAGVVWRVVGPAVALAAAPGRRAVRRAPGGPCADIAAQNALAASVREFMGHRSCMRQLEQLRVSDPVRSGLPVLVVAANGRLPRRGLSPWAQHVLRQARRFEPQGRVAVRVVSRSGHFVMLDQPRRTAELIASAAGG